MVDQVSQMFAHVTFVDVFNFIIFLVFSLCYLYQIFYILEALVRRPKLQNASRNHRYAVMISARNEEAVIANLIHSIKVQNYPSGLIDVFVVADNCTDNTAQVAADAGAIVFKRFNAEQVGKGYALDFCYKAIQARYSNRGYEAYFVFDADNVLDVNFFTEMNKVFDGGAKAATSYRNSKNFGSNWISAGYGIRFIREARFLNQARSDLHTSCAISGTGFYIAADVLQAAGGWKWHLLTEDIEFSADSIIHSTRISYCPTAMLYDEQPLTFRDSWNQRIRWSKGFYQVFWHYAFGLLKGLFTNRRGYKFACYDMLMIISPAMLLTLISVVFNGVIALMGVTGIVSVGVALASSASSMLFCLAGYLAFMFAQGMLTTFVEWDMIRASTAAKIKGMFTFPFYMITDIPIALVALVKKVEWKPIRHTIAVDVEELSVPAGQSVSTRN